MTALRSYAAAALAAAVFATACNSAKTIVEPDPPRPPVAVTTGTLRASQQGWSGLATVTTFVFNAAGFVSTDGTPLSYQWSFGDGTSSVGGASVSHVYGGPGLFDVRVVATNAAGRSAEANLPALRVTTLTGRWTAQLAISSGPVSFEMTQDGAEIHGMSDYYGPGRSVLSGRLTSPGHLDLTLTVPEGSGGVTKAFSFPFSLDTNFTATSLTGWLTGPPFCPCPAVLVRQ